ncbi:DUF3343 domain-containing protein [Thermodesulforhabdus norvegica]|uniref:Uncharacterized protein n=1 Tax=Thermodesulforhabdus norvegica TaxID=39841 RepID=A0A1I4TS56_9BACT|nr:DUF3343 domain-containing protein [Thermodesulforhabdus norvegica]SFM79529.1 Protein of unknown function [Thermodesulforhabdus norvegica]
MKALLRRFGLTGKRRPKKPDTAKVLLIFAHTGDVIRAESLLKSSAKPVRAVGPPAQFRKGCDLALEIPAVEQPEILEILRVAKIHPVDVITTGGAELKPTELFQIRHFGNYLMVRAANMKITVDKDSGIIVNVSGGGCPDVPYLAKILIGKPVDTAPDPMVAGRTLCGYTLGLAFREAKRLCSQ